jgi:hypothetical protein
MRDDPSDAAPTSAKPQEVPIPERKSLIGSIDLRISTNALVEMEVAISLSRYAMPWRT